jgi:hypothetical protein
MDRCELSGMCWLQSGAENLLHLHVPSLKIWSGGFYIFSRCKPWPHLTAPGMPMADGGNIVFGKK